MARPQAISIVGHSSTIRRERREVRSAMSEMESSRGQRVLGAPSHEGGWTQDGSETASSNDGICVNTALNP